MIRALFTRPAPHLDSPAMLALDGAILVGSFYALLTVQWWLPAVLGWLR